MDQRALGDAGFDDGLDRGLLNIGQHLQDDLAAALDHAENGRLFLFERSASGRALQSVASALATFFSTAAGLPSHGELRVKGAIHSCMLNLA
jgi:hypothetical protein